MNSSIRYHSNALGAFFKPLDAGHVMRPIPFSVAVAFLDPSWNFADAAAALR